MTRWLRRWWAGRPSGIRTRLAAMLLGVLLLVIWQTALAVRYTVELFDHSERVQSVAAASTALDALEPRVERALVRRGASEDGGGLPGQLERLSRMAEEVRGVAERTPMLEESLGILAMRLGAHATLLTRTARVMDERTLPPRAWVQDLLLWQEELEVRDQLWLADNPSPDLETLSLRHAQLRELLTQVPTTLIPGALLSDMWSAAEVGALRRSAAETVASSAARVRADLSDARGTLSRLQASISRDISNTVGRADRYLVTLVLLTVVYIVVLVFVMPERLLAPLRHTRSVVQRVARGHYEIRVAEERNDEFGDLARDLDHMLDQVLAFDELKRERIHQDRVRIARLAELAPQPLAFLDARLRLSHANQAFRELFALPDAYQDRDIRDQLSGADADELTNVLEAALRQSRSVTALPLRLKTPTGHQALALTLEPGRDSEGRVAWLLMRLTPAGP